MSKPTTRIMSRALEGAGQVGGHRLAGDLHVGAQAVLAGRIPRRRRSPRRAPQVGGQAIRRVITPGHSTGVGHHVLGGHHVAEHRQRVVARHAGWPWRGSWRRSPAWCRTSACARGRRRRTGAGPSGMSCMSDQVVAPPSGARSSAGGRSVQCDFSAPGFICSKPKASAQSHRAAFDGLARQVQRGRAGRAVVVDVDDRDAGHADSYSAVWPQVESPYT